MGRLGALVLGTAALVLLTIRFGRPVADPDDATLTFSRMPTASAGERAVFERFARARGASLQFDASEPLHFGPSLPDGRILSAVTGHGPDVITPPLHRLHTYTARGLVLPLAPIADRPDSPAFFNRLPADHPLWRAAGVNGDLFALPTDYRIQGVIYRRDRFAAAGVPEPSHDWTWDDLLRTADVLADGSDDAGLVLPRGRDLARLWITLVWQAGGDVVHTTKVCPRCERITAAPRQLLINACGNCGLDLTGQHPRYRLAVEAEPARAATDRLRRLWARSAHADRTWPDAARMLADGRAAMLLAPVLATAEGEGGIERLAAMGLAPDRIGTRPMPAGPDGRRAAMMSATALAVAAHLNGDPARRQAADAWLAHAASDDALRLRVELAVRDGRGRFVHPELLARFQHADALAALPVDWRRTDQISERIARVEPMCPDYEHLIDAYLLPLLADLLASPDADAVPAVARLNDAVNDAVFRSGPGVSRPGRRRVAMLAAALLAAVFATLLMRGLWRLLGQARTAARRLPGGRPRAPLTALLFILPAAAAVVVWHYVPLFVGAGAAVGGRPFGYAEHFAGLGHVRQALFTPFFWRAAAVTLAYTLAMTILGVGLPLCLALLLRSLGRRRVPLAFLAPIMMGPVAGAVAWRLGVPDGGLPVLIAFGIWLTAGVSAAVYLNVLARVGPTRSPHDLLARLSRPLAIHAVAVLVASAHMTQSALILTGGGPAGRSRPLGLAIFQRSFLDLRPGSGAAMGWMLGAALVGLVLIRLKWIGRRAEQVRAPRPAGPTRMPPRTDPSPMARIGAWIVIVLWMLVSVAPLILTVIAAAGAPARAARFGKNLRAAWALLASGRVLLTTLAVCGWAAVFALVVNPLAAFALSRLRLNHAAAWLVLIVLAAAVPVEVRFIANALIVRRLGLMNTWWALVLPGAVNVLGVWLLKERFDRLPDAPFEQARLAGWGPLRQYWHVAVPLARPLIWLTAAWAFFAAYGSLLWPLVVGQDHRVWTAALWLHQTSLTAPPSVTAAGVLLLTIPGIVVGLLSYRLLRHLTITPNAP